MFSLERTRGSENMPQAKAVLRRSLWPVLYEGGALVSNQGIEDRTSEIFDLKLFLL
jgi:hypothetical protein